MFRGELGRSGLELGVEAVSVVWANTEVNGK